jgi:hypothetical protein
LSEILRAEVDVAPKLDGVVADRRVAARPMTLGDD